MKAIVIKQPGGPEVLQVTERPIPEPSSNEVLIKISAAGINRPDIAQRKGHYPPPANAPQDVPGLEVSGIITVCGSAVTRWKPGDAVCALLAGGGYAEYAIASAGNCLPVPANIPIEEAASLPETVFTVYHNVFERGKLQPGENFLVHGGSGGIGITAIQMVKAWGASVFTTAGSNEKCTACLQFGATACINYKEQDFEKEFRETGMDVILDMIGGDYTPKNVNLLREDGRLVYINAMKGTSASLNIMDIMRKRLTITGSTLRNRDNEFKQHLAAAIEQNVWQWYYSGDCRPVIYKSFLLKEAGAAHMLMESSGHIGKIILINK